VGLILRGMGSHIGAGRGLNSTIFANSMTEGVPNGECWFNKLGEGTDAENSRRMVVRYIRKARKLAGNVGRGEFPGSY
jgi:hypothetical protein